MGVNYAVTDLSAEGSLQLVLTGPTGLMSTYHLAQFSATFAVNEIPSAQCLLAVGRNVIGNVTNIAEINRTGAAAFQQMTPARVLFTPKGTYRPGGTLWPAGTQIAFDGYLMGFAYRKVMGKFVVVANLMHWLADLGCSSCLNRNYTVSNPTNLSVAGILSALPTAGAQQGVYTTAMVGAKTALASIGTDVWAAIKSIFCGLANVPTNPVAGNVSVCFGSGTFDVNTRALKALAKIEGGALDGCPFQAPAGEDQTYAVPLALVSYMLDGSLLQAVQNAIGLDLIDTYASMSFWDKLVTQFCPNFGMAVVPMVQRALVIADLPAFSGTGDALWRVIEPEENDSYDFNASLERPLRGIAAVSSYATMTMPGTQEPIINLPTFGGCFAANAIDATGDGLIQIVNPPDWLMMATIGQPFVQSNVGVGQKPFRAAGADALGQPPVLPTPESTSTFGPAISQVYNAYAQKMYLDNMLRGRMGAFSGKLRFDIAPGSVIQIQPHTDSTIGVEDSLAFSVVGCVSRVTIEINAESALAGTSFQLTHLRTSYENDDRTSMEQHPYFGKSLHGDGRCGAPLIPAYDL